MAADRFSELFKRFLSKTAGSEEKEALAAMALEADNEEKLKELISQSWEQTGEEEDMTEAVAAHVLSRILRHQDNKGIAQPMEEPGTAEDGENLGRTTRVLRPRWQRLAIAASVLVIAGGGIWTLMLRQGTSKHDQIAHVTNLPAPGAVKAMITLANGQQIALDSAPSGLLARQGDADVMRDDNGDIRYADSKHTEGEVVYNTIFNPRGSKVAIIILADGTRVWLNNESSLRFYSGVGKRDRKVELSGEAYFEVARDPVHKFIVATGTVSTEVLGTHFNVTSYKDEPTARITLLEGAIRVKQGPAETVLKPGQQASVTAKIEVIPNADTGAVVAWKDGKFNFQDQPLRTVLKQVARWYDFEVIYENDIPDITFFGEIESNVSLAQMLLLLKRSGVKFTMDSQKKQLIIH